MGDDNIAPGGVINSRAPGGTLAHCAPGIGGTLTKVPPKI